MRCCSMVVLAGLGAFCMGGCPRTGTGVEWDGWPGASTDVKVMISEMSREDKFTALPGYSDGDVAFVHHNKCYPDCEVSHDEVWYFSEAGTVKVETTCGGTTYGPTTLTSTDVSVGCNLEAKIND